MTDLSLFIILICLDLPFSMTKSESNIQLKPVTFVQGGITQIDYGASNMQAVGGGERTKEPKGKRKMGVEGLIPD